MISQQTIQGNWKEIQGKLKSTWGSLTDDDVKEFDGNVEQLIWKTHQIWSAAFLGVLLALRLHGPSERLYLNLSCPRWLSPKCII